MPLLLDPWYDILFTAGVVNSKCGCQWGELAYGLFWRFLAQLKFAFISYGLYLIFEPILEAYLITEARSSVGPIKLEGMIIEEVSGGGWYGEM